MATFEFTEFSGARIDTASRRLPKAVGTANNAQRADTEEFRPHKAEASADKASSNTSKTFSVYSSTDADYLKVPIEFNTWDVRSSLIRNIVPGGFREAEGERVFSMQEGRLLWMSQDELRTNAEDFNLVGSLGVAKVAGSVSPNSQDFSVELVTGPAATREPDTAMTFAITRLTLVGGDYPPDYLTTGNSADTWTGAAGAYNNPTFLVATDSGTWPGGVVATDNSGQTIPAGTSLAEYVIESAPTAFTDTITFDSEEDSIRVTFPGRTGSDEYYREGLTWTPDTPIGEWYRLYASFDGVMFSIYDVYAPERRPFAVTFSGSNIVSRAFQPLLTEGTLAAKDLLSEGSGFHQWGGPVMAPNNSMLIWSDRTVYPSVPNDFDRRYPDSYFRVDGQIKNIIPWGSGVVVLTDRGALQYSAGIDGYFTLLDTAGYAPCVAPFSADAYHTGVIYASTDGLYLTQGSAGSVNLLKKVMSREVWNGDYSPEVVTGIVYFDRYYFVVGKLVSTTEYEDDKIINRAIYELDLTLGVLTKVADLTDLEVATYLKVLSPFSLKDQAGLTTSLFRIPNQDGIWLEDVDTPGYRRFALTTGAYTEATWESGWITLPRLQAPNFVRVDADAYPVSVRIQLDNGYSEYREVTDAYVATFSANERATRMKVTVIARDVVHSVTLADTRKEMEASG